MMQEPIDILPQATDELKWYALVTRSRHEKQVRERLEKKGLEAYLPTRKVLRQWCDRKRFVEQPLFTCYVFIRMTWRQELQALQTDGVARFVRFNKQLAVVRDKEIENIKCLLNNDTETEIVPYIGIGRMVRIKRGPLKGVDGVIENHRSGYRLLLSVKALNQSMAVEINMQDVEECEAVQEFAD
jgi:transcriptional antiterminator RfaH